MKPVISSSLGCQHLLFTLGPGPLALTAPALFVLTAACLHLDGTVGLKRISGKHTLFCKTGLLSRLPPSSLFKLNLPSISPSITLSPDPFWLPIEKLWRVPNCTLTNVPWWLNYIWFKKTSNFKLLKCPQSSVCVWVCLSYMTFEDHLISHTWEVKIKGLRHEHTHAQTHMHKRCRVIY